jgi:predicted nucleic acid-binding protein
MEPLFPIAPLPAHEKLADDGDDGFRLLLRARLIPRVRSPKQAQLRRLLRGCEVVPFDEPAAHTAGVLLGKTRTIDVVDASVAALAMRREADVVSDDAEDIRRLLSAARVKVSILDV